MTQHAETPKFSPEVCERAVRMVREHRSDHPSEWATIASIAAKSGCTAQTLSNWLKQDERDHGKRAGLTTDDRERLRQFERENWEPREANEILRVMAETCFAWTRLHVLRGVKARRPAGSSNADRRSEFNPCRPGGACAENAVQR